MFVWGSPAAPVKDMTKNQFLALCGKYAIDPALALENDDVVEALRSRDADEVERILAEEF